MSTIGTHEACTFKAEHISSRSTKQKIRHPRKYNSGNDWKPEHNGKSKRKRKRQKDAGAARSGFDCAHGRLRPLPRVCETS